MLIEPCLSPATFLNDFTVIKQFNSKKNKVFWVNTKQERYTKKQFVLKKYDRPQLSLRKEVNILQAFSRKNVAVPQLVYVGDDSIVIEYIEGPLLLDFICWQENVSGEHGTELKGPIYQAIYSLCSWFKDFYSVTQDLFGKQIIRGDVNFRNFIIREKIYGIDFEECREGRIEEDIGRLCAFALTYTPAFTAWKIAMTGEMFRILTHELNLEKELTKKEMIKALLSIARRRKASYEMVELLLTNLMDKDMGL